MRRIGVIPNISKDRDLKYTGSITGWITERGCEPLLPSGVFLAGCKTLGDGRFYGESDIILVLGGDGSMLRAAGQAALYRKPIFGINLGTLGFLTDADKADGFAALDAVLSGRFTAEKRMMISLDGGLIALNDICVNRGLMSRMISIIVCVNGEYAETIRADGLIVSTPTGSTAYNLSAGGPILKPDSEMIAITAVCPHELFHRPWVVSAEDSVTLRLTDSSGNAVVSLDGQPRADLLPGRPVEIRRSEYYTTILKTKSLNFYEILRKKMGVSGLENKEAL